MGNLFIADDGNFRIRKVDTNGVITTVAGNGIQSFSGDGGAATNAALNDPISVAVDFNDNLFIADANNSRIRKVDTNGIITTVAGNGTLDYSGAGDGGAATNAGLATPIGVAVDALGNLFIADANTSRIRKVDTNGIITTVAGSTNWGFSGDGGAATRAWLANPFGVTVDASSNLFIADNSNFRIREVQYNFNSPELVLDNVSTNDAGNYSAVITGSSGSITSSVVTLTVIISPPSITAPTMLASGQFQFSFDTVSNVNYAVQCSTNLMKWFPLLTLGGIGTPMTLIDSNTAGSQQRFYRISLSAQ